MEVKSKEWNWKINKENLWLEPCDEIYSISESWKKNDFHNILDYGCGLGRHSVFFAKKGFNVKAFDLSKHGIEYLRNWAESEKLNIETTVADMLKLPYKDNSIDSVFAYHVVYHTTTDGIRTIIKEIERVIKSKGELFITLGSKEACSYNNDDYPKLDENTIIKVGGIEDGIPHFFVDYEDLFELFSNFKIKYIKHIDDCFFDGKKQRSKHYFLLAEKK